MPLPDEFFDAAYSVESLCYAPDPAEVYREAKQALKSGTPFTFHDFAMMEKFDENIPEHRKVRNRIEFGNGITRMPQVPDVQAGLRAAGESSFSARCTLSFDGRRETKAERSEIRQGSNYSEKKTWRSAARRPRGTTAPLAIWGGHGRFPDGPTSGRCSTCGISSAGVLMPFTAS